MLKKETLFQNPAKRIELAVWKDGRGRLVMHLQEWDVDVAGYESFILYQSWNATIARDECARATKAAIQRFYDAHAPQAKLLVAARVAAGFSQDPLNQPLQPSREVA